MFIIPAAGESERFTKFGYKTPKWNLNISGITMLEKSLESLGFLSKFHNTIIVTLRKHEQLVSKILEHHQNVNVEYLDSKTDGQADTVYQFTRKAIFDYTLSIWNCDSWLNPEVLRKIDLKENFIITNKMKGDRWSFVATEEGDEKIIEVTEKIRISEKTSIGFYNFSSVFDFNHAFIEYQQVGEKFVAPLYNNLISKGYFVKNIEIKNNQYVSYGTPEEYINEYNK